jgi:hypothetical protein
MTDGADSGTNQGLDPSVANIARFYDYMLGGKDNFSVDRQLGSQLLSLWRPAEPVTVTEAPDLFAGVGRKP